MNTPMLYDLFRQRFARFILDVFVLLFAFLLYPTPMILLGFVCLFLFEGYEVILAALILDALLAPGGGAFGEFHYTTLFLLASSITIWLRGMVLHKTQSL